MDSAEFLAQRIGSASASISTVSDAEAEVTSLWTGNGIKSFVEDPRILVTMNNGSSCVGAPTSILGNIYSSGTTPFHIDSIIIEGDLLNEFSMKNPGDPRNIPTLL